MSGAAFAFESTFETGTLTSFGIRPTVATRGSSAVLCIGEIVQAYGSSNSNAANRWSTVSKELVQTIAALNGLADLPARWNSYNAAPIDPETIAAACYLVQSAMLVSTPPPAVVPTVRGGVQLEWHRNGVDLEIRIDSPNQAILFVEDSDGEHEEQFEPALGLRSIQEWIKRVSKK